MNIRLAYGKEGLVVDLPEDWDVTIVEPQFLEGIDVISETIAQSLRVPIGHQPLCLSVKRGQKVGIIFNDISRATPTPVLLKAILEELGHIPDEDITLFNALGTHRPNNMAELQRLVGDDLANRFRIVQNDCANLNTQGYLGTTSRGNPVWINRELLGCDLLILTGFIEPHFFAGFSGGGKAIMPGMAGLETILGNHSAANIAHPGSTWGVTEGNPIWEEVGEVARMVGRTFLVNVALNRNKEITAVFAGDLFQAHSQGCAFVKRTAMVGVDEPFDIVVTSNSGYPLDLNLYQAVKGMSAAAQIVKNGGAIVIAAECWDGIPEHGLFGQLLRGARNARSLLDKINTPGYREQDQWQAQILAQILTKADVFVYNGTLSPEVLRACLVKPAASIEGCLRDLMLHYGARAKICVLPEGPVTIPYVRQIR